MRLFIRTTRDAISYVPPIINFNQKHVQNAHKNFKSIVDISHKRNGSNSYA